MGKYIGQDITYGYFEKQTIVVLDSSITEYELNRSVSSATSIQVVCERAILEPNVDYVVFTKDNGKSAIRISNNIDLTTPIDGTLSLYVIYLGAKLLIPSSGDQNPELWDAITQKADVSLVHTYVDGEITNLVNGAPEILDTLKELSSALNNDEDFANTVATNISTIQTAITNEETRAQTAESNLQGSMDTVSSTISELQQDVIQLQTDVAQKPDSTSLATVATSGSYDDLNNKPTLFSGSYDDLTSKPTLFSGSYDDLNNKPTLFDGAYSSLTGKPTLATVATSGYYTDLIGKPGLSDLTKDVSIQIQQLGSGQYLKYNGTAWVNSTVAYSDVTGKPTLATVATSGLYSDLSSKPTLASFAALTSPASGEYLKYNGSEWVNSIVSYSDISNKPTLASFTTLTSPASGKYLKYNGSEWVNSAVAYADVTGTPSLATVATSGSYNDLSSKPTLASFATLTSPSSGQYLKYNGSAWVNSTVAANDVSGLSTVATSGSYSDLSSKPTLASFTTLTSPASGQYLKYNGSAWVNSAVAYADVTGTPAINISSPTSGQLLVYDSATSKFINTATDIGNIVIGSSTTQNARLGIVGSSSTSSSYGVIVKDSSNNFLFYIRNDGLINTGTQGDTSGGSPYQYSNSGVSANLYVTSGGTLQRASSSIKYKRDVVDAPHGLDKVLELRYVNFKSKNPEAGDKQFGGLIAEEVHATGLTEFVDYGSDGTPEGIHYANMVALAFKAIQQLNAKIETLEAKIAELESK